MLLRNLTSIFPTNFFNGTPAMLTISVILELNSIFSNVKVLAQSSFFFISPFLSSVETVHMFTITGGDGMEEEDEEVFEVEMLIWSMANFNV